MAIKFAPKDEAPPLRQREPKGARMQKARALVPADKVVNNPPAGHVADVNISGIELPLLTTAKVRMVGVRMTEEEIAAIDAARGKVSRQDFLRKAALWLADQADRITHG